MIQDYLELFGPGGEYCTAPKGQEDKCKPGAFMSQGKKNSSLHKAAKKKKRQEVQKGQKATSRPSSSYGGNQCMRQKNRSLTTKNVCKKIQEEKTRQKKAQTDKRGRQLFGRGGTRKKNKKATRRKSGRRKGIKNTRIKKYKKNKGLSRQKTRRRN